MAHYPKGKINTNNPPKGSNTVYCPLGPEQMNKFGDWETENIMEESKTTKDLRTLQKQDEKELWNQFIGFIIRCVLFGLFIYSIFAVYAQIGDNTNRIKEMESQIKELKNALPKGN